MYNTSVKIKIKTEASCHKMKEKELKIRREKLFFRLSKMYGFVSVLPRSR